MTHVVVSGPPGTGKSTLVRAIAASGDWHVIEEQHVLVDKPRILQFAYSSQYFLASVAASVAIAEGLNVMRERCLEEAIEVFGALRVSNGDITPRDLDVSRVLLSSLDGIAVPDFFVMLTAAPEVTHHRLEKRGGPPQWSLDALTAVSGQYHRWFADLMQPKVLIDTSECRVDEVLSKVSAYVSSEGGLSAF